ncbi:hypothetical protein Tco_1339801, partial [Tanacetum coccineum]
MAPKRATRSTPVTTTPAPTATTTTTVTNAQLQAMIDQGVSAALAARDATRNGIDSHTSGTGVRGSERIARECTYQDFMKCKPLYFKGTEGVVELTQWCSKWYVGGLPDMIHGNIVASKPKTMQEAIEMATELMDKRSSGTLQKECPRIDEQQRHRGIKLGMKGSSEGVCGWNSGANQTTSLQKYMQRGFPIFLAHVTAKEVEDKSEKKRLEDVSIVQDFPEVFPEDLSGLPPTRQVEFQMD